MRTRVLVPSIMVAALAVPCLVLAQGTRPGTRPATATASRPATNPLTRPATGPATTRAATAAASAPAAGPTTAPAILGAMEASALPVSSVTIHATAKPQQHLAEMQKQAGIDLSPSDPTLWTSTQNNWPAVKLDVDKLPVWEAIRALTQVAQMRPSDVPAGAITISSTKSMGENTLVGSSVSAGPLLFVASTSRSSKANPGSMLMHVWIHVDPKIAVFANTQALVLTSVTDENGKALTFDHLSATPSGNNYWARGTARQHAGNFLTGPADVGTKLHVQGSIKLLVATKVLHAEVPGILKGTGKSVFLGDLEIKVGNVTTTDRDISVDILPQEKKGDAWLQLEKMNSHAIALLCADKLGPLQQEVNRNHFDKQPLSDRGRSDGTFEKLVLEAPGELHEVTVPLDFKDVPVGPLPN